MYLWLQLIRWKYLGCCWTNERLVLMVRSIKVIAITASLIAILRVRISRRLFGSDTWTQAGWSHTVKKNTGLLDLVDQIQNLISKKANESNYIKLCLVGKTKRILSRSRTLFTVYVIIEPKELIVRAKDWVWGSQVLLYFGSSLYFVLHASHNPPVQKKV